jgi:hypothetical protein
MAAVGFQPPAEAVTAELLVSLLLAVVACLPLSVRPTRAAALALVVLLLSAAALTRFPPPFGVA